MLLADLLDISGENKAVRSFLLHYQVSGISVGALREHMTQGGWDGCWPEAISRLAGQAMLTPAHAQAWLRHLFDLEQTLPATAVTVEPVTGDMLPVQDGAVSVDTLVSAYEDGVAHGRERDGSKGGYQNPAQSAAFMLGYNAAAAGAMAATRVEEDRKLLEWLSHSVMTDEPSPADPDSVDFVEENSLKGDVVKPSNLQGQVRNVLRATYAN